MGWFNSKKARKALEIPRKFKVMALMPVGYPASRPPRETVRKPLREVVWWNRVGEEKGGEDCGNGRKPES